MAITLREFVAELTGSGLLADDSVARCLGAFGMDVESGSAESFAEKLVAGGRLTQFQADAVLRKHTIALVIGDYHVLDEIGAGGMGQVYRARHRFMDRVVAIKLMHNVRAADPRLAQRFAREVKAAAALNHPNIVTAHDAGETADGLYLAMEYVDGPDLSQVVKSKGALTAGQAVNITIQAARGLAYAHARNIVHRDIKPANLLLGRDGTVKILDMGLARFTEEGTHSSEVSLTMAGRLMGTIEYMAPEHAANAKDADHRSDIYALGCTMYRLLTGKLPYGGSTPVEKLIAQREHPIPRLSDSGDTCQNIPEALQGVFARMVAKKPEDRYQSADEVIAALIAAVPDAEKCDLAGLVTVRIPAAAPEPVGDAGETAPESLDAGESLQVGTEGEPTPLGQSANFPGVSISQPAVGADETVTDVIPVARKAEPNKLLIAAIALAALAAIGVGLWAILSPGDAPTNPNPKPDQPAPRHVLVDDSGKGIPVKPGQWVNLAAEVKPEQVIEGQWKSEAQGLVSDAKDNSKIIFPTELEGSYDLRLRLRRLTGGGKMEIVLPVSGTRAVLGFGHRRDKSEEICLRGSDLEEAFAIEPVQNGREYLLDVSIRTRRGQVGVRVDLDGERILNFSAPQWRLRAPDDWQKVGIVPGRIALATEDSCYTVSDLQVRLPLGVPLEPWDVGENLTALAPRPAKIEGVKFWALETRRLRGRQTAMAFSPDGRWIATTGEAGTIRILDAATGKLDRMFVGHRGTVFDLSFSKDSRLLASASKDGTSIIWDFSSGRRLHTLVGHEVPVMGVAFSPDGKTLATAGRSVGLWDVRSGRFIRFLIYRDNGAGLLKWSPDGKMLATAGRRGSYNAYVWNIHSGQTLKSFETRLGDNRKLVAWSPDGKMFAVRGEAGGKNPAAAIAILNTESWEMIRKIDCCSDIYTKALLAWSPDGMRLLFRDKDKVATILDTETWKAVGKPGLTYKDQNDVYIWSPDGKALAVRWCGLMGNRKNSNVGVGLIDSATGRTIWEISQPIPYLSQGAASPEMKGATLVGCRVEKAGTMWLWHSEAPQFSREFKPGRKTVLCAAYSPDGKLLAFADTAMWGSEPMLHILDTRSLRDWKSYPNGKKDEGAISLSLSPDGRLVCVRNMHGSLLVWDAETGQAVAGIPGQGGPPDQHMPGIWMPDSRRIISLMKKDPKSIMGIWDARSGSLIKELASSEKGISGFACSGDGKVLAVLSNRGDNAELWDIESGAMTRNIPISFINGNPSAVLSRDGALLAAGDRRGGGGSAFTLGTGYIHLWDTPSSGLRTLFGHPTHVRPVSFSIDGSMLATHCDRMLRIWDVAEGLPMRTYMPLPATGCMAISADGHYAVSEGVDVEKELLYVVVTGAGQEMLTPSQFATKYGWKNDPAKVSAAPGAKPIARPTTKPATTKPSGR
ncbi:MAG: protein kinase [Phycisphaerae bacterium]|nr:protein kinase [Phycisphaerae bacterium]